MYAPADTDIDFELEQGFGARDPWPSQVNTRTHRFDSPSRTIILGAVAIGGLVVLLGAIQLFNMWFDPCFHGAC